MDARRLTERRRPELALRAHATDLLRRMVCGEVFVPGDVAYDQARKVWNGMVDRHPAAVVYCAGPDDVVAAVNFARSRSLLVAARWRP
jgi:hypothetical protein